MYVLLDKGDIRSRCYRVKLHFKQEMIKVRPPSGIYVLYMSVYVCTFWKYRYPVPCAHTSDRPTSGTKCSGRGMWNTYTHTGIRSKNLDLHVGRTFIWMNTFVGSDGSVALEYCLCSTYHSST